MFRSEVIHSLPMLVLLSILIFIYHLGIGIHFALGVEPSLTLEFLYTYTFLCGVVWWLKADIQRSGITNVYCPGLLVGYGWIVIIPYHLFKTRGARGLIPILVLIGSFIAAWVCVLIVYIIFPA